MAGLGLRAGEVATLELDDLDWHAGQLRLRAGKCRRKRVLPLSQEIGAALAEYLQHGRSPHWERRVFLTLTNPAAIGAAAVSAIVRRNLVRSAIPLGRLTGAHMLRHTAASRMVNGGAGLKEVADVPGYRSLQTDRHLRQARPRCARRRGAALNRRRAMSSRRYQIVVGHVNFEGRSYNLVLRTLQSPAEVAAIVAGQGNRTVWMVNARAEGWIEHGAAGGQFQFVTAWLQAEEPTS